MLNSNAALAKPHNINRLQQFIEVTTIEIKLTEASN